MQADCIMTQMKVSPLEQHSKLAHYINTTYIALLGVLSTLMSLCGTSVNSKQTCKRDLHHHPYSFARMFRSTKSCYRRKKSCTM